MQGSGLSRAPYARRGRGRSSIFRLHLREETRLSTALSSWANVFWADTLEEHEKDSNKEPSACWTLASKYLFNCRKEKHLLDHEEGPVSEAGYPHTSRRPQGLFDAAASKQSWGSHEDVANWLSPDDRLATPVIHVAYLANSGNLETAALNTLVHVNDRGSTGLARVEQHIKEGFKCNEFSLFHQGWRLLLRPWYKNSDYLNNWPINYGWSNKPLLNRTFTQTSQSCLPMENS